MSSVGYMILGDLNVYVQTDQTKPKVFKGYNRQSSNENAREYLPRAQLINIRI
jgi:hypothetical protein